MAAELDYFGVRASVVLFECQRLAAAGRNVSLMARRSQVSQPHFANWLSGRKHLSIAALDCVVAGVRIDVDALMFRRARLKAVVRSAS